MKKILITGITGQDGIFLTNLIKKQSPDAEIVGVSRYENHDIFYKKLNSVEPVNTENITLLNLDLLNSDNVDKLIKQYSPNTVYNLSGPSSVYESLKNPFIEEQIKIIFNNLTNSLISSNNFCNFFQASSSEMFGNTNTEILNENTDFSPNSPYALAKLNNHNLVKEYSSKYNWNIFSGIMFNHESRFRHENYLIMKIITTALQISSGKADRLSVGSLDYQRDWSFAGDVVSAIYKITNEGKNYSYVIGSGKAYSIKDILEIVFSQLGLEWSRYTDVDQNLLRKGDPKTVVADTTKIRKELGWSPTKSFKNTLLDIISYKVKN